MKRGRPAGNPTPAERDWLLAVKAGGCICCLARGYRPRRDETQPDVEAHHLLSGGIRTGHLATVGLCMWHHRARLIVEGWTHAMHRDRLGPSLAEGSKRFHEAFGGDDELLAAQHRLIEQQRAA